MIVTFNCNAVQTQIVHYHACHEIRNRLLSKLFFPSLQTKVKFM